MCASINKLMQSLASLALSNLKPTKPVLMPRSPVWDGVREFHGSFGCMKNFKERVPLNCRIGRFCPDASVDMNQYSLKPIRVAKTGGRGPDGRIWIHRIGGGRKMRLRMIDMKRTGPKEGPPLVEKVNTVGYDPTRTARIAVVASGNSKRYIIASENMKPGDLIKTSGRVSDMPVQAFEGDAHPVGSLPLGTMIHMISVLPDSEGTVARAAGTSGMYLRRIGDQCVIRMPSKREIVVSQECMVTVGRVSNPDWHKDKKMHKAGENRWRGKRPKSGLWQRKTGYHGRKIKPMKPPVVYDKPAAEPPEVFSYTV